ncbi:zinc finger protein GAI-ASSOCIATED FACTOR 1-like [Henckelia pumila]|uniref:zinc finger protein GAI-ASSOCIATED FACTOR 1-like n=1 Tax=Henckelia pumila TaxID=405737 RepID=UPI003C6E3D56
MAEIENSASQASGESGFLVSDNHVKSEQSVEPTLPVKKKRNLPGMPDPDAEVIALSPKTLMATNRFVCEICNKGFQRDQNLQLHRRGHNLPWKLRQRTNKEIRKRVYLCPEPTCIHHDPSRALGDLTGIKKHFCRKHGEKKFKCERCSKKYAVQSDWKAHMKTCGTREYRCDCGTLFSRRDSFITHRAFCDALAQESALSQPLAITSSGGDMKLQVVAPPVAAVVSSPPPPPLTPSTGVLSPVLSIQSSELPENHIAQLQPPRGAAAGPFAGAPTAVATVTASNSSTSSGNGGVFGSIFNVSTSAELSHTAQPPVASYSTMLCTMAGPDQGVIDPMSLTLSSTLYLSSGSSSLYPAALEHSHRHYTPTPQPALSATALLQKAAQMGATSSNSSFLRGLGLAMTPPPDPQDSRNSLIPPSHWNNTTSHHVKLENNSVASGLGLGLPSSTSSPASFNELMMNSSSLFGNRPATLDFLGLGMGAGETSAGGFSAFLSSITDGLDSNSFAGVGSTVDTWDYPSDRKPSML